MNLSPVWVRAGIDGKARHTFGMWRPDRQGHDGVKYRETHRSRVRSGLGGRIGTREHQQEICYERTLPTMDWERTGRISVNRRKPEVLIK